MSQNVNTLLEQMAQRLATPTPQLAGDPATQALLQQRVQEGLQGPTFDFANLATSLASHVQSAPVQSLRTLGMSSEQVNKEYEKTGKLLDQQLATFLSSADKGNQQKTQMFEQALSIRNQDLQAQRADTADRMNLISAYIQKAGQGISAGNLKLAQDKWEEEKKRMISVEDAEAKTQAEINLLRAREEEYKAGAAVKNAKASGSARTKLSPTQQGHVDHSKMLMKKQGLSDEDLALIDDPVIAGSIASKFTEIEKDISLTGDKDKAKAKAAQLIIMTEKEAAMKRRAQTDKQEIAESAASIVLEGLKEQRLRERGE